MHGRRNRVILTAAALSLLVGVGLEHPYFNFPDATWSSAIFNMKSLISLLKELAFALFIAWLIIVSIETEARKSDRETADRLRRDIAADVFKGVFARALPTNYVDVVVGAALRPNLLRDFINLGYTIEPLSEQERAQFRIPLTCVVLARRTASRLRNVSARPVDEEIEFTMPHRLGTNRVTKFLIGPDIRHMKNKTEEAVINVADDYIEYKWPVTLAPGETVEIVIEDRQIKNVVANEIFCSFHPTLRADITLNMRVPGLKVGINGWTATPLVEVHVADDGSSGRWEIDGPILPNDSVVLWWGPTEPPSGAPQTRAG